MHWDMSDLSLAYKTSQNSDFDYMHTLLLEGLTYILALFLPGLSKSEAGNDHGNLHGVGGHSRSHLTHLIA